MALDVRESIAQITRREVEAYAGGCANCRLMRIADDERQIYVVIAIPDDKAMRPTWTTVCARVVGGYIVIEEDTYIDKPLVDALMVNAGIPRDRIILAYKGETLPAETSSSIS